ncbi:uncharacterized protein LAESUDRAFT_558454 [Laetiporus sulphureus 93-53]|uniref:Secreted protein n=1 Tax=Laetiporus sulphureus 93-53 TaxID=1314785 RepID=A0A165B6J6_9APHY|nr:uncharacterized protein LAESUDRAFT_558454 [Laetiporus sulphureus 93-53]KZT00355.1 hypothetical protein LAESUDRAFT_558454 [Laetiporus sulphureus 93-53]
MHYWMGLYCAINRAGTALLFLVDGSANARIATGGKGRFVQTRPRILVRRHPLLLSIMRERTLEFSSHSVRHVCTASCRLRITCTVTCSSLPLPGAKRGRAPYELGRRRTSSVRLERVHILETPKGLTCLLRHLLQKE